MCHILLHSIPYRGRTRRPRVILIVNNECIVRRGGHIQGTPVAIATTNRVLERVPIASRYTFLENN